VRLVDSHCHLDDPAFAEDFAEVLARAAAAGVGTLVSVGTRLSQRGPLLALAETHPQIFATLGNHPHHVAEEPAVTAEELAALSRHPRVVGIGECGLDYFYDFAPREVQEAAFRVHIAAARLSGLPLVVHTRDADDDTIRILRDEAGKGAFTGLLHCFSSGRELAETALELGMSLSFSGVLTFKRSEALRAIARDLPEDRILVETDSPYLAPVPKRGKRNEPAFVALTARVLAETRGISPDDLGRITSANFRRLFTKAAAAGEAAA